MIRVMTKRAHLSVIALFALCGGATGAGAATLKIACSGLGQEMELCQGAARDWAKATGNAIEVVSTPNDGSERLALFQQLLGSGSSSIDVLQVDVAQVGLLASQLLDLAPYSKGVEKEEFPSMVSNSTIGGKLLAMPWFIDAGLLYYRKDLLDKYHESVPKTWDDLKASAARIQDAERKAGNNLLWGYVWQGRAYEGLTCNGLEMVASYGGGEIVDSSGKVTIGSPSTVKAFGMLASFVGVISPTAVLNYAEEESRGPFQNGNAVFMRNWPYAWAASQAADSPIKGRVGVSVLPKGGASGRNAATLGGQELAVSKHSANAALAADLVMYMSGPKVQKERAIKASYNPTFPALYADAELRAANPFMGQLQEVFASAVPRPTSATGAKYNQVSTAFYNALHDVLAKTDAPDAAVAKLNTQLNKIGHGGTW
jgi:trehalose/maltose transport system substrate-binding protein